MSTESIQSCILGPTGAWRQIVSNLATYIVHLKDLGACSANERHYGTMYSEIYCIGIFLYYIWGAPIYICISETHTEHMLASVLGQLINYV